MTVMGFFEAWWVAPGSPESIWFWAMVGIGLGLCQVVDRQVIVNQNAAPIVPHPITNQRGRRASSFLQQQKAHRIQLNKKGKWG
jgi:hypothetical protein